MSKGNVVIEAGVAENFNPLAEEAVPEPDAARIGGQLWLKSPLALARLAAPLLEGTLDERALARHVADLYGFEALHGLELDAPAAVFWLQGSTTPLLVFAVETPDEVLARLPAPVVGRQGNEYSFSIGVTRAAYLNFFDTRHVAISSDWRHYPLARERIREVMAGAHDDALLEGELDVSRLEPLVRAFESMPAPLPRLRPGWRATRDDLAVLLGSTGKVEVSVRAEGRGHALELRLTPQSEQGGLRTLVRDAEPSAPAALFARLPDALTQSARAWLWQDLRHAPLELEALPGAVSSLFAALADDPAPELEAVREAELARSRSLAGPTLWLRSGHGESERIAAVAPIGDRAAFDAASAKRAEALRGFAGAALPAPDPASAGVQPVRIGPEPVAEADPATTTGTLFGLEQVREAESGAELVVLARHGVGELSLPGESTGGAAPASLAALTSRVAGAKPLLLWVADPGSEAEPAEPVMLGVFTTGEQLVVELVVPEGQLSRLVP